MYGIDWTSRNRPSQGLLLAASRGADGTRLQSANRRTAGELQGNGINWTAGEERGCKRMPRRRDTRRAAAEGSYRESKSLLTTRFSPSTRRDLNDSFQGYNGPSRSQVGRQVLLRVCCTSHFPQGR